MRPLPISADTAVKLAAFMKVPIENLMHMPQHILLQKLQEMAMAADGSKEESADAPANVEDSKSDSKKS